MLSVAIILVSWSEYINMLMTFVILLGCVFVLFSHVYQSSGRPIPIWHRAPLLAIAIGSAWVFTTCFAGITSDGLSDLSYRIVGVFGELLINLGLASIVVGFSGVALREHFKGKKPAAKKTARRKSKK